MTIDEKLDAIAADISWVKRTISGMGFGPKDDTPRVIPGDGSKPADPPPPPTPATPADPPVNPITRPPNIDPFIWNMLNAGHENDGQPTGSTTTVTTAGDGGGYDRPVFDFRNGDILRITGSGSRSVVATRAAQVAFSVGESGGAAVPRHVVVTVSGAVRYDETGNYHATPLIPVQAGEVIVVTVSGEGIVSSARLTVQ